MSVEPQARPVAIVTGGARGLGYAIARSLADAGFDIAVTGRSPAESIPTSLAKDFEASASRFRYFQHDTADNAGHTPFIEAVIKEFGALHCLVNNVGLIARPRVDILDLKPADLDAMYEINLRGSFFLSQAFAKALLKRPDDGHYRSLINVTSIAAEVLNTGLAHYCASKAALASITQTLALKLAEHGVMVHDVRPGFLWKAGETRPAQSVLDDWIEAGGLPMKRRGSAEEVGEAVAALAQGRLRYMTGQPIWLAGGVNIPTAF